MKISKQELLKEAVETGFRPEIMEKVWHLMAILDGINVHPFLKDRLALKGGTALNLFFFFTQLSDFSCSFAITENGDSRTYNFKLIVD